MSSKDSKSVAEAIKAIQALDSAEAVADYTRGDRRVAVREAADARIAALKAQAEPPAPPPVAEDAPRNVEAIRTFTVWHVDRPRTVRKGDVLCLEDAAWAWTVAREYVRPL